MPRLVLGRAGGRAASALAPTAAAAPAALMTGWAARQAHAAAAPRLAPARGDEGGCVLSSGHGPSSVPPDSFSTDHMPGDAEVSEAEYGRLADMYMGGLWDKMKGVMCDAENNEGGTCVEVQLGHDSLKVSLPEGGRVVVSKDLLSRSLLVQSNLHDTHGSHSGDTEVAFRLQADRSWEVDGEELHS